VSVYLQQPRASIDALQRLVLVAHTLGLHMAELADARHTLATDWSLAAVTHRGGSVAFAQSFHLTVGSPVEMTRC